MWENVGKKPKPASERNRKDGSAGILEDAIARHRNTPTIIRKEIFEMSFPRTVAAALANPRTRPGDLAQAWDDSSRPGRWKAKQGILMVRTKILFHRNTPESVIRKFVEELRTKTNMTVGDQRLITVVTRRDDLPDDAAEFFKEFLKKL